MKNTETIFTIFSLVELILSRLEDRFSRAIGTRIVVRFRRVRAIPPILGEGRKETKEGGARNFRPAINRGSREKGLFSKSVSNG